jgi:hypothetical protein
MTRPSNAKALPTAVNPLGDILAVARRIHPGLESSTALTFKADADFPGDANHWVAELFAPVLLPALLEALDHARAGRLNELSELDQRLTHILGANESKRSLAAGHRLAAAADSLRGDRLVGRVCDAIRNRSLAGHFLIVFAARSAAFSISDRVAVAAYAFMEASLTTPPPSVGAIEDFVSSCLLPYDLLRVAPALRAA